MINNELIHKEKNSYFGIAIILILNILLQIILARATQSVSIVVGTNLLLLSWLFYKQFLDDLPTILLLLTILPFIYIDKAFSRTFVYIVIQNITLVIFLFLSVFHFIYKDRDFKVSISYIFLPVILYTLYSIILAVYGAINHNDRSIIIIELYQNLYYIFVIPIAYLINSRKKYTFLIKIIIATFLFIAIEYIIISLFYPERFTTYHNHLFPLILALLFSALLFKKGTIINKLPLIFSIIILFIGSIVTGTRTLLVTNFIVLLIVSYFYLKFKEVNFPLLKTLVLTTILVTILLSSLGKSSNGNGNQTQYSTQERIESISNPTGEVSFLMRVEAVYLGMKKILIRPFFGYGFGDQLQMRWLLQTKFTFPDNNYIYYWLKGGIFFLFLALWMFYRLFRQSFVIYKKTESSEVRYYMVAIIAGMFALMIFALMNANLVKFKLNIIYAFIFAYVDFESKSIKT